MAKTPVVVATLDKLLIDEKLLPAISSGATGVGTTAAYSTFTIREAGTISRLWSYCSVDGTGSSTTFTIYKNGSSTAVTHTSTAAGYFEDASNSVAVSAGDTIYIDVLYGSSPRDRAFSGIGFMFEATNSGDSVGMYGSYDADGFGHNTASASRYYKVGSSLGNQPSDNESSRQLWDINATWSDLTWYVTSNSRTTTTTAVSRINGADGNQTINYTSGQTGIKTDASNTDTVTAGDEINWQWTNSTGTGTILTAYAQSTMVNTNRETQLVAGFVATRTASATVHYLCPVGGYEAAQTTENNARVYLNLAGTLSKLYIAVSANSYTGAATLTLRKNGVDTGLTVSITAATTGYFQDTTNSVTVADGDYLTLSLVGGTANTMTFGTVGMVFQTDAAPASGFTPKVMMF